MRRGVEVRRAIVVTVGVLLAVASRAAAEEPSAEQVRAWVAQLDDDDAARREEATLRLMEVGPAGEAILREAEPGASPEAQARIQRVLDILSWGLPVPYRARFEPRLAGFDALSPADKVACLESIQGERDIPDHIYALLVATAFVRERSTPVPEELAEKAEQTSGVFEEIGRRAIRALPGLAGFQRFRGERERVSAWGGGMLNESYCVLCASLDTPDLGDLAVPMSASDCLFSLEETAASHYRAASALESAGLDREAFFAWRRRLFVRPDSVATLGHLDALAEKLSLGEAHLALLRWIATGDLPPAMKQMIETQTKKWSEIVAKRPAAAVDLSRSLGLRHYRMIPATSHSLVGQRAVYVAGSNPQRVQSPDVFAYDRATGDLLWAYAPPAEPNTSIEMADDTGGALREVDGGLLVVHEVTSEIGSGGSLDLTACRTRLTLLSRGGRPTWSREYDIQSRTQLRILGGDLALFLPGSHEHRGRAWAVRIADGQVASTFALSSFPAPVGEGRIITENLGCGDFVSIDVATGKRVWESQLPGVQSFVGDPVFFAAGEAIYVTTGRHVSRMRASDGRCEWVRGFDADESTIAPIANDKAVFVVLDTGGEKWTVAELDPATGEVRGRTEMRAGRDPSPSGFPPPAWESARWVAADVFLLRGRLVDLAAGRVIDRTALFPRAERELTDGWGILMSERTDAVPYVEVAHVAAEVNPRVEGLSIEKDVALVAELRKKGDTQAADAVEELVRDWDPTAVPMEKKDGK